MTEANSKNLHKQFLTALRKSMKQVEWVETPDTFRNLEGTKYSLNGNNSYSFTVMDYSNKRKRKVIVKNDEFTHYNSVEEAKTDVFMLALLMEDKIDRIMIDNQVPEWYQPGMAIPTPDKKT